MMPVVVALLATLLIVAIVFAVVCFIALEGWRINCLMAERERDLLLEHRDDLRRCLAACERIMGIAEATTQAIRSQIGR